ncbi:MAG TPA: sigma-70 family RNA polymerase sigma factor, partial [Isosphaeraceae bacterium]|nr:sigma-70 family RNA polymerase sigma factor [Isosphaeraceae bacterium]
MIAVLKSIEQLFHEGSVAGLDDGQLLERFASHRDEAAFAGLVAMHGPMVLGVCRRILRVEHDVEDAFQATFLVLVKKAGSIRDAGRLGPWLHGVARRVALRVRAETARRRAQDREYPARTEVDAVRPGRAVECDDLLDVVDAEVARLPARYRDAVVLCDLEGRSYAEAARRLRCPLGTLQSRLARGRTRLRARLLRRGLAPLAITATLAEGASAAVPQSLAEATVRAAVALATGQAAGVVSATVAAVVASMMRAMLMTTVKTCAMACVGAVLAISTAVVAHEVLLTAGPPILDSAATSAAQPPPAVAPAPQRQPEPAEAPKPGRTLNLEVVNKADNLPLAGATLWVRIRRGEAQVTQEKSDDEGRCAIALPGDSHYSLQVAVAHPGFVPVELGWSRPEVPETSTIALERGVTIGGTVHDEQGQPIVGARVFPRPGQNSPWDWPELATSPDGDIAARTDAQGRWRSDSLPANADPNARLNILVTHPEHVALKEWIKSSEVRAQTNVLVLKTGRSVSGTVLSPTGRPVAGATIIVQHRYGAAGYARIQTDASGQFHTGRFIDPREDALVLAVQAEGFASTLRRLTNTLEIPPQVVRLTPRRPLRGRVVDAQGRPVPGAVVRPFGGEDSGEFDWEAATDTDGRFVWFEAPTAGMIRLDISKPSFRPARGRTIDSRSREVTLTLHRAQHLHGTVTDAETGRPIDRFALIPGDGPFLPGVHFDWRRDQSRTFTNGRFDLTGDLSVDWDERRSIRIEADGYESAELIGFAANADDIAHDFRLRKATRKSVPLTGIVRGADGRSLAGVEVAVCIPGGDVRIKDGRLTSPHHGPVSTGAQTDRDGRYTFRPQEGRVSIVAAHDAGFAMRDPEQLAATTDITLAPWGRIEGVMKIGTRPAGRQKVSAWLNDRGPLGRVDYDALTDDNGRFILERVTPGQMTVYRYVDDADHHGWTASDPIQVDVKPGQTIPIQIGGTGRPVVGRLALPEGLTLANFVLTHGGNLSTGDHWPPYPDDYPDWTDEQQSAWWDTFRKTSAGREYFASFERHYAVTFRPDGSFRIEDVPAGRYVLKLPFSGNGGGDPFTRRAFARTDVVVPEIPGGRSDEPLDLGVIPLDVFPFRELNVGDRVPEIKAKAADGRPLDLAALRGKVVLLAFWATYHGPTLASIPHLKATYDAFGRDPRLVIIGLNEDVNPDIMRRYVAHHGLRWEQRYLG